MASETHDYGDADDDDYGDECGRWWGGRLTPWSECTKAGSEFCDFECPYGLAHRARHPDPEPAAATPEVGTL